MSELAPRTGFEIRQSEAVTIEAISTYADLPADANALLLAMIRHNPFVSAPWLEAFERELIGPHEAALYLIGSVGGRVLMVLPLIVERRPLLGVVRVRAMGNFYTGLFDAAMDAGVEREPMLLAALGEAAADFLMAYAERIPLIEMQPACLDGDLPGALMAALSERRHSCRRFPAHANWYEDVSGIDFAEYMARRPGPLRSTLMRKRKRLTRERGFGIEIFSEPASVAEHFRDYEAVYAVSWKASERSPAFIRTVMSSLAAHGIVNLGILRIAGVPAAAQVWVKIGGAWGVFKLAYDPRFAEYSVGTILTASLIEAFFASGRFDTLDFLSGDDAYKRDWMASRRLRWGFEALSGGSLLGRALLFKRRLQGITMSE